jgi:hypothetical protein
MAEGCFVRQKETGVVARGMGNNNGVQLHCSI